VAPPGFHVAVNFGATTKQQSETKAETDTHWPQDPSVNASFQTWGDKRQTAKEAQ